MSDCVLIGGVFDPLHAGHLDYIREAKKHGWLMCVLSDAPHKHQPLVPMEERETLLRALGVDIVMRGNVAAALEIVRPKAYIKGKDWEGRLPAEEVAVCDELGIQIVFTDTLRQSSSQLLADYERRRNAEKLAAFEAFVQGQQPAEKPWEPVTDYSWEARKAAEGPHAQLIKDTFQPENVLDVGCGPCHLVKMLRELGLRTVDGWDKQADDPGARVDIAEDVWLPDEDGDGLSRWFANGWHRHWDLVICREVLEHLTVKQIAVAVRNLVKLSSRYVYLTTRFARGSHLLDVDASDTLDPTHISMLNIDMLRALFVLEGCTRRADLEAQLDWKKVGRVLVYEVPRG